MRTKRNLEELKIAIVHEWLINFRGSEKVLLELLRLFPHADLYASVVDRSALPAELANREIHTTFIQKLPNAKRWYQKYLFVMPIAYEQLDLSGYDLVISNSHSCAKGIYPANEATHICYCYTPMRYAWSGLEDYRRSLTSKWKRWLMTALMYWMREWDVKVNDRVDHFIAISHEVQQRIEKYYQRSSTVIFPGVEMPLVEVAKTIADVVPELAGQTYYLALGRLVPYKRMDLAVEACNRLGVTLLVAGNGSELEKLKHIAGSTIYFLEEFTDEEAQVLYRHCEAFVFPGEEDYGLTVVEAQLHGKPVVAYGRGGVLDTVIEGQTGVFFHVPTVEAVVNAIVLQQSIKYDEDFIMNHARNYSNDRFRSSIMEFMDEHVF
jgi:glycosyltransferase involved in cell wall biosynthesis